MLRFRGKDVLRISKYNMLMFIILGLLGLGISVGYLCRHVPAFKGLEHSISYTIFAMLFIFGITIGANQSLLNNIGEFGIQAAILAICGVLGSLVASFIAYKLFIKKGRPRYPSRIESGSKRRIRKDGKGYPVFQFVTAVLYDHRHVSILCGGEFVIDLVEYI